MKTAYELAMERLQQTAPPVRLSESKKRAIAEIESKYKAKLAEREIFLKGEIAKAAAQGDFQAIEQLEKQLSADRKSIQVELEEKKDQARQAKE